MNYFYVVTILQLDDYIAINFYITMIFVMKNLNKSE